MLISIIVPVYNGALCLERCINSILEQTYKHFEIIIINDGSTDDTPNICNQMQSKDQRIKVKHISNCGQGGARNVGIGMATGGYITFVDADDEVQKHSYEGMISEVLANDVDIICGHYHRIENEIEERINTKVSGYIDKKGSTTEIKNYHRFKTTSCFGYVWNKLYKTEFIKNNDVFFDTYRRVLLEDTLFNLKLMAFAPKFLVINQSVYKYYIYSQSTSNKEQDITERSVDLLKNYALFLKKLNIYENQIDLLLPLALRVLLWAIIKRVQREGLSYSGIVNVMKQFMHDRNFKEMVYYDKCIDGVLSVQPFSEKAFFVFTLLVLRAHLYGMMSIVFIIGYPIMRTYIKKRVKRT